MATITILLPVYNGARFLSEAMESIRAQTFGDWELLALDDGSTDATPILLNEWVHREPRLKVFSMAHRGLVSTLNHGLDLAQGKFIARMDADDRMAPTRLERQVRAMLDNPAWAVCGTGYRVIDDEGQPGDMAHLPLDVTACRWQVLFHAPFAHPTVMLRRSVLEASHLRYDPAWRLVEDLDLWMRLLDIAPGGNLADPLLDYRVHPASISQLGEDEQQQQATRLCLLRYHALGVHLDEQQAARLRAWYYRWPARIQGDDFPIAQALWQLLQTFIAQTPDTAGLRQVRGRWLARLLLTPAPGLDRRPWRAALSRADLADVAFYAIDKAREAF
jgi:hypothetical protein